MIVRIFKSNQTYIYFFIPLVLFALRWPALISDPPFTPSGQLPFLTDFFAWLTNYPVLSLLLGITAITFQAFILSETVTEHRLLPYTSNMTAFILALCYSIFAPQSWFSPVIFANVFCVLALKRILDVFHQGYITGNLFRAGFYVGLASLLYLPSVFMLLILFYDLLLIRTFHWREFVIPLIGLITPYIYFLIYYFFKSDAVILFNYFLEPKTFLSFLELRLIYWIPSILALVLIALALIYLFLSGQKRTVRQNNLYKVIVVTFVAAFFLSLIYSKDFMSATALLWPSVAIVLTYFLLGLKRKWVQEVLVGALITFILIRDILTVLN